jgi:outer membrane protein assembly factor BamE (lipoprotein component of BamABCDE complex)
MKTMKLILSSAFILLAAGCATTFKPWNLSNVQEGMPREQVIATLGDPDYTVNKDGAEYLYYTYQEELAPISDDSLKTKEALELRVGELNRTLKDYKYEVMLVEGKVLNYKELKD